MKWVTRERAAVDRIACPWLIRRFIDPSAEFLFVPADRVMDVAREQGATPFDVPGAALGHVDGRCSFESILVAHGLDHFPELVAMGRVIHAADIPDDPVVPEGAGLKAIAEGFRLLHGNDDHLKLVLETPLYDALYAWACRSTGREPAPQAGAAAATTAPRAGGTHA